MLQAWLDSASRRDAMLVVGDVGGSKMFKTRNIGNAVCSHAVTIGGSMRGSVRALVVGLLLSAAPHATQSYAQEWPQRTVRLILPFGPASAADTAARVMSDPLA